MNEELAEILGGLRGHEACRAMWRMHGSYAPIALASLRDQAHCRLMASGIPLQMAEPGANPMNTAALASMDKDQLLALIATMQAQPARKITAKVSEKGALSVYGLGRFPVTLYRTQWERLLADDTVSQLKAFITANAKLLAVKE